MTLNRQNITLTCLALTLLSLALFLINIQFPKGPNFDEFHYIPAAKELMERGANQNWEHPPLAKYFIALGTAIGGDRPFGWRLMSAVFGSATLLAIYFLALALFRKEQIALWVALITLFNQFLYVQARIAMLDTFMAGFLFWALVFYVRAWDPARPAAKVRKYWLISGTLIGLAMACKWFVLVPWVACLGLIVVVRVFQNWGFTFSRPSEKSSFVDWYSPQLWRGVSLNWAFVAFIAVPLVAYALTFLPLLLLKETNYGLLDLITLQVKMWDGQLRVTTPHPYMSQWWQWLIPSRPIWYAFDKEGDAEEWVRGVFLLGNPVVIWAGLAAIGTCLWGWLKHRSRAGFLIFYFFAVFFLSWVIIPRKVSFYYYFYPAALTLSLALGFIAQHFDTPETRKSWPPVRWGFLFLTVLVFIYFFPVLAALRVPAESFVKWMWLPSWI